jgi:hypothetical protein
MMSIVITRIQTDSSEDPANGTESSFLWHAVVDTTSRLPTTNKLLLSTQTLFPQCVAVTKVNTSQHLSSNRRLLVSTSPEKCRK